MVKKEEWEDIQDNSTTGFERTTDKGLIQAFHYNGFSVRVREGSDIVEYPKEWEKAQMEMTRRLKNEITRFNEQSSIYSKRMYWLTIIIGVFTLITAVPLVISFYKWIINLI